MADSMHRILINTIVKNAIGNMKTDPERTIRNLVDMALKFADSRFQEQFYSRAQGLLSDEKSGYYALVKDTVTKVKEETLLTFCMNLGYNGLYEGSQKIRKLVAEQGYHVPWMISMTITEGKLFDQHHRAIEQGERLGVHSWYLFSNHAIFECLTLAEKHPESSFVIFCNSCELSRSVVDHAEDIPNIAFAVSFDKNADVVCDMLRDAGILYGLFYTYSEKDLEAIESGELVQDMEQLYPAVSILKPHSRCDDALRERVYRWVTQARLDQEYHTIPWELYCDTLLVDKVISEPPFWVGFDEYGQLHTQDGIDRTYGLNIFVNDLPEVLSRAFPKEKGTPWR